MPVEAFPRSQPTRRNPSESDQQQTHQIRHVTCDNPSLGYENQEGSACVNYGKSSRSPLGYDNQDHMQLAYTYTSYNIRNRSTRQTQATYEMIFPAARLLAKLHQIDCCCYAHLRFQ
jgi:hypothetical protein